MSLTMELILHNGDNGFLIHANNHNQTVCFFSNDPFIGRNSHITMHHHIRFSSDADSAVAILTYRVEGAKIEQLRRHNDSRKTHYQERFRG